MLEFSKHQKTPKQLYHCLYFLFAAKKDCYRDFSIGQIGFGSRSILRVRPVYAMASSESFFFGAFSIFESGGITKHLRETVRFVSHRP